MEIATKSAFRTIGPVTVSTGWAEGGKKALVEVSIRVDRMAPGDHAEDIQFELANLLVQAVEKRYHPRKA